MLLLLWWCYTNIQAARVTFISPKDHDDEDEDEETKSLRAKDKENNAELIADRKSNWVQLKLPVTLNSPADVDNVQVSYEILIILISLAIIISRTHSCDLYCCMYLVYIASGSEI